MAVYIYVPKPYSVVGDPDLTELVASPLTYKTAEVDDVFELDETGFICAYGRGELITGGTVSSVRDEMAAWTTDTESNTVELSGLVVHLAPCDRYEFPDLINEDWAPAEFRHDVEFTNNYSGTGQFLGRSVKRISRSVDIRPLTITTPVERAQELHDIRNALRATPIYVQVDAPMGAVYTAFGWTEEDPEINYTSDYGQVSLSFSLRSTL